MTPASLGQRGIIGVRPATAEDCDLLWRWVNEPAVRAASFNQHPIPWTDHVRWFNSRLASPDTAIYIVLDEQGTPIGQVRFEIGDEGTAQVGVSIAGERRGRGFGAAALQSGIRAFAMRSSVAVEARIRPDNEASLRAFERAGFERAGVVRVGTIEAVRMMFPSRPERA